MKAMVSLLEMEYIKGEELYDYLVASGRFDEGQARKYFKQMLSAVEHMHSKGKGHCDYKPENIMVDHSKSNIKVIDYGLVMNTEVGHHEVLPFVGTPGYQCPEIVYQTNWFPAHADLFAIGVILFIMVAGHPPFSVADPRGDNLYKLLSSSKEKN